MRCATLSGSAPRRPRPPGDGSAPGRWPKTRPTRATRLDWRVYPWVSSFFIKGYLMQVKTNKVVVVGPAHRRVILPSTVCHLCYPQVTLGFLQIRLPSHPFPPPTRCLLSLWSFPC